MHKSEVAAMIFYTPKSANVFNLFGLFGKEELDSSLEQ